MKKRVLSTLLVLCMTTVLLPGTALAKSRSSRSGSANPSTNVEKRSEMEIWNYFNAHPFDKNKSDTWVTEANIVQGEAGKLSDESQNEALATLNFVRYIAGIPTVSINSSYEGLAQAGAALLDYIDEMTHYPDKPAEVSQQFYDKAYEGTSSSNIAYVSRFGYYNLSKHILQGWMDDGDLRNIDRVGHRRWCLDPRMTQTGFGESGCYSAMYAFGHDSYDSDYTYIPWPAQVMPVEYFYGPWSVSINSDAYTAGSNTKVTLLSSMTGQQYVLDNSCTDKNGVYFNVETTSYGLGPAVIFEPNVDFSEGDEVFVNITGLTDKNGRDTSINYSVRFFSMDSMKSVEPIVFEGTWENKDNVLFLRTGEFNQLVRNQWACIDGNWYYFKNDGHMAKGLCNIDNEWYYFGADGIRVSGWLFAGSQWYYFAPDGKMYRSAITPDGYEINENGAWVVNGVVQTQ